MQRDAPPTAPCDALRDALARIDTDGRVLVAFSGGLDSTVLLHAAVELLTSAAAGSAVESRKRLLAIHVDHRLQAPSAEWARHCVESAASLGVDCRVVRLAGAPRQGESVEAWAREHRYAAFVSVAAEVGAAALLTAHHADDQLETFLLRLARGAGLDGLVSIEPDTMRGSLRLLRPFLGLPHSVLEAWARSHGLAWIEDPSNRNETLLRNAVRRQLIPEIDRVLPMLRQRLPETLAALRKERDRLREIDRRSLTSVLEPTHVGIDSSPLTVGTSPLAVGSSALSLSAWRK
ncbi:MAG TPA: tRNA lysidine(34) synthetase TilS, partial [Burkholderiaceae bacterium]|nr:tRNA lysidine(34) synthetase TilS [Burkholderiaceae bacterium]